MESQQITSLESSRPLCIRNAYPAGTAVVAAEVAESLRNAGYCAFVVGCTLVGQCGCGTDFHSHEGRLQYGESACRPEKP